MNTAVQENIDNTAIQVFSASFRRDCGREQKQKTRASYSWLNQQIDTLPNILTLIDSKGIFYFFSYFLVASEIFWGGNYHQSL